MSPRAFGRTTLGRLAQRQQLVLVEAAAGDDRDMRQAAIVEDAAHAAGVFAEIAAVDAHARHGDALGRQPARQAVRGPPRGLQREAVGERHRPPLAPDPFESLVTSISAQQVSLFAAFAIRNRMIERFGERVRVCPTRGLAPGSWTRGGITPPTGA